MKSNAKNKNKNSNAKINPAIKLILIYLLLKTIGLSNNFIQIIIKINAINDLIPAKNIGFKPKFTIFITTWFIPNNKEKDIKAIAPNASILVFFCIVLDNYNIDCIKIYYLFDFLSRYTIINLINDQYNYYVKI